MSTNFGAISIGAKHWIHEENRNSIFPWFVLRSHIYKMERLAGWQVSPVLSTIRSTRKGGTSPLALLITKIEHLMEDSSASLLRRARQFDRDALGEIYDKYSPILYRYVYRQLGEVDLAEECVSETFRRFLQALRNGGGPDSYLTAYLYRIAQNWINDYYRTQIPETISIDEVNSPDPAPDLVQLVSNDMDASRVRWALGKLTSEQRQVIALRFLEGWSIEETAQALGKSVFAIKAMQTRALLMMRKLLTDYKDS